MRNKRSYSVGNLCRNSDWEEGVVELGRAKVSIYAKATGGNPLERAKTVKQMKLKAHYKVKTW